MSRKRRREFLPIVESLERRELLAVAAGRAPILQAPALTQTYVEDLSPAFILSSSATLVDTDSASLSGGTLTVGVIANANASDRLSIVSQPIAVKGVLVANSIVSVAGARVGTCSGGVGATPLVVKFDSPGATPAAAQAILRQIAFQTLGDNPSTLPRTLQVTAADGNGNTSMPLKRTMLVNAVNDAPQLLKIGDQVLATTEGNVDSSDFYLASSQVLGSPLTLAIPVKASDPDSASLQYSYRVIRAPAVAPATIAFNAGVLSIVGKPNATGSMTIEVTATDGKLTDSCQFRVDCNETTINNIKIAGPILRTWLEGGGTDGYGNPTATMTRDDDGTLTQQFQYGIIRVPLAGAPTVEPTFNKGETAQPGSATYSRRPTLVVLVQGASPNGYCIYDWEKVLRNNLIASLEKQGSQPHVMEVLWDTYAVNTRSVPIAAQKINAWLNERQQKWDVLLVGHSRGGVFTNELSKQLTSKNIEQLHNIMLDPTASVVQGDEYPKSTASAVDRAVTYDDGYPFVGTTFVQDGFPIPGAEYKRVAVPRMVYMDTYHSHGKLADYYASTLYTDDLSRLLQGNPADPKRPYQAESVDVYGEDEDKVVGWHRHEILLLPKQTKNGGAVIEVKADFSNGTAHGSLTVLGVGSADVTIGKSGVAVSVGIVCLPKVGAAITEKGATIQISDPTGLASGGVIVSKDETRLDVSVAGVQISIGGPGAGVYIGGNKISINRDVTLPSGTFKWDQTKSDGSHAVEVYSNGVKTLSERRDVVGNYTRQRYDASRNYVIEKGTIHGTTWIEERDHLGVVLSQGYLEADKWVKDKFFSGKVIQTDFFSGKFGSPLQETRTWNTSHVLTGIKTFDIKGGMIGEQFTDSALGKWVRREFDGLGHKLSEAIMFGDFDTAVFQKFRWNASGTLTSIVGNAMVNNAVTRVSQQFLSETSQWVEQRLDAGKVVEQAIHFGDRLSGLAEVAKWNTDGVNTTLTKWGQNGTKLLDAFVDGVGNWVQTTFDIHGNPIRDVWDKTGKYLQNLSTGVNPGKVISGTWKKWVGL